MFDIIRVKKGNEIKMKNLSIAIGSIFLIILIVAFSYVMINTSQRKTEVRTSTTEAMEQALSNLKVREYYELENEKQLAKYFSTYLTLRLETKKNSAIVNIYDIDFNKGLIDAECSVTYPTLLGTKVCSVRKTLICDLQNKKLTDNVEVD